MKGAIAVFLILAWSAQAEVFAPEIPSGLHCEPKTPARFHVDFKTESRTLPVCRDEKGLTLISAGCYRDLPNCIAAIRKRLPSFAGLHLDSERGSPGFQLCHAVSGDPRFIEVKIGDNWIRNAICVLKSGVFLDHQTMSGIFLRRR